MVGMAVVLLPLLSDLGPMPLPLLVLGNVEMVFFVDASSDRSLGFIAAVAAAVAGSGGAVVALLIALPPLPLETFCFERLP